MSRSTTIDQRGRPRVPLELPVRFGREVPQLEGFGQNLSETGIFVRTNEPYRVGERVVLEIEFPKATRTLHGNVMWAIRVGEHEANQMVCGMGIQFVDTDVTWLAFVRNRNRRDG